MKCLILLSWKYKKDVNLLSAEIACGLLSVNSISDN